MALLRLKSVFFALTMLLVDTAAVPAQSNCGPHAEMVAHLTEKYQEKRLGYGMTGNFAVTEIYISTTGTWTVIITDVTGHSCIVAAGEGWETTVPVGSPEA